MRYNWGPGSASPKSPEETGVVCDPQHFNTIYFAQSSIACHYSDKQLGPQQEKCLKGLIAVLTSLDRRTMKHYAFVWKDFFN